MADFVLYKGNNAAWAYVGKHGGSTSTAHVQVEVKDEEIRKLGVAHDGYEKVFAYVPDQNGNWNKHYLKYNGTNSAYNTDSYGLDLRGNVRVEDLRQMGVAFGIEISGQNGKDPSTVWLQGWNDNYKLNWGG